MNILGILPMEPSNKFTSTSNKVIEARAQFDQYPLYLGITGNLQKSQLSLMSFWIIQELRLIMLNSGGLCKIQTMKQIVNGRFKFIKIVW